MSVFICYIEAMPMLKLDKDDPQKELEFEVECALMHSPEERLKRWLEWNLDMFHWMEELHGRQNDPKIVKRT